MSNSHDEIKKLLDASRKLLNNDNINEDIRRQYGLLTEQGVDLTGDNVTKKLMLQNQLRILLIMKLRIPMGMVWMMKKNQVTTKLKDIEYPEVFWYYTEKNKLI